MKAILLAACLASLSVFGETEVGWAPNPPEDEVRIYVLEHRPVGSQTWTRVEVAGTLSRVVIPESAFGRWFRIAAVNPAGLGEWSDEVKLPAKVSGIRITVEITP